MEPLKQRLNNRLAKMRTDQSLWTPHWQELSEQMQPRRARFYGKQVNDGTKRNDKIINNTPLISLRVAAAGMMAGITSPARQWFRLIPSDPDALNYGPFKRWIFKREQLMSMVIARSNIYNALAGAVYVDQLVFGTHASFLERDDDDLLRMYPQAIGEYYLATNERGVVDTLGRDIQMTVRQTVRKFGLDNVSERVKNDYQKGNYEQIVDICHKVCPNQDYETGVLDKYYGKRWASYWWEKSSPNDELFLRKAGYDKFPVLAPRWALTNAVSDVYGFSPGMDALGDCKELQHLEARKAMLVDKLSAPPLAVPEEMKNSAITLVPGKHVYVPRMAQGARIEPIMVVPPAGLQAVRDLIMEVENRVAKGFYADLWLQIIQDERVQPRTAREIAERHEEKMLQLGPVVERSEDELLDPMLDEVFDVVDENELQEPPPDDLKGMSLKIEYISVMAQAQRLVNFSSTERFVSFALGFAQAKPTVLDKLNEDVIVERMAQTLGTDPEFVKDQDTVDKERAARAQREQMAQMGEAAVQGAKGAKDASQVDPAKLQELAGMISGPIAANSAGFMPPGGMPQA